MKKAVATLTLLLFTIGFSWSGLSEAQAQVENLAFKILQKQAAEYEVALSEKISKNLTRYIPEDRFHLSVRIFWNPEKLKQVQTSNRELQKKSGKLPGFQIFVRNEEQGLDYYLGAGSVMKLKVEVLIDEKLPKRYADFIYQLVPIQARFVPARGDMVQVVPIPFPEATKEKKLPSEDMPLVTDDATKAVMDSVHKGMKELTDLKPVILHPVLQRYVSDYEEYIQVKLTKLVSEYVEKKKFLLDVKFYWNADEINNLKNLVVQTDVEGKVKLPGFRIYLEERDSLYKTIANSTTLMRMDISVILDDSVGKDVEPFLQKIIPLSIKINTQRGDQLRIYTGHFPKKGKRRDMTQVDEKLIKGMLESDNEIIAQFSKIKTIEDHIFFKN